MKSSLRRRVQSRTKILSVEVRISSQVEDVPAGVVDSIEQAIVASVEQILRTTTKRTPELSSSTTFTRHKPKFVLEDRYVLEVSNQSPSLQE